jgi:hypothetical protein
LIEVRWVFDQKETGQIREECEIIDGNLGRDTLSSSTEKRAGVRIPSTNSRLEPLNRPAKVGRGVLTAPQEGRRFCAIPGGLN